MSRRVMLTIMAALTALAVHLVLAVGAARGDEGDRKVFASGVGARALALGGAYTAAADDATALVWNPAGLARAPAKEVALYTTTLPVSDISYAYFGYAHPTLRFGTFAAGAIRFSAGGIEGRDDRNFVTDDDLGDSQMRWLLGYANELRPGLAYGVALKFDTHSLGSASATSVGADLGLTFAREGFGASALSLSRARVALRLENVLAPREKLGSQSVEEPRAVRAGLSYALPMGASASGAFRSALVTAEYVREEGGENGMLVGAEVDAAGVAMRAGLGAEEWSAGGGVSVSGFSLDYAFSPGELGAMHRLSLAHMFGMTRVEMAAAAREREEREVNERLAREIGAREEERVRALVAAGREHLDAQRFDEARDALSSALLFVPEDAEVQALHGRAEREALLATARGRLAEGDTVEALIAYQRALEKDSSDEAARREMETVAAQRAAARVASAEAHRRESQGLEALAAGRYADAESIFAALLADEPESLDARRFLDLARAGLEKEVSLLVSQGNLLDERGLHGSAIAKWRAALALAPGDRDLKKKLSEAEREKSEREVSGAAARAQETSVARRAPLSPAEKQEIAELYEKGAAVSKQGRTAEAIEYWEIVWRRDPDHGDVKSHLAKGYLIQGMEHYTAGRLSEAIEVWKRALDVDPSDPKALQFVERAGAELAKTREITRRDNR